MWLQNDGAGRGVGKPWRGRREGHGGSGETAEETWWAETHLEGETWQGMTQGPRGEQRGASRLLAALLFQGQRGCPICGKGTS